VGHWNRGSNRGERSERDGQVKTDIQKRGRGVCREGNGKKGDRGGTRVVFQGGDERAG